MKAAILRRLAWSVAAVALAVPRAALADDVDAAREAFLEARTLGSQGRWAEAAERYGASLRLHKSALTLYSLGVAQKESGKLVEARESFAAFLAEPSTEKTRAYEPRAREAITDLDRRAAHITIVLEPGPIEHPTVAIDGNEAAGEGLTRTRPVDPGAHEIVARAPGRTDARARLTIPEGGAATVTLTLAEIPVPPAPPTSPEATTHPPSTTPPGAPVPPPIVTAPPAPPPPLPPPPAVGPRRTVPFALMGAGSGVFVAGLAVGLAGVAQAHAATASTGPDADAARAKATAGDVLAGCGIVTAGVGLVLLLTVYRAPSQSGTPHAASTASWITTDGTGMSLRF